MCKIQSRVQAEKRRAFLIFVAALAGGLGDVHPVLAQTDSSRPIRLLVPLAPGGATDPYARLIAEHMARTLGRVIIVEHKPGGSGNVGTQYAAHEPADGNLILLTTQAMTEINPSAFTNRKWSLDEFIPLIRGVQAPLVLVANPTVPAKTLDELVAWIRKNPGKLSYSSYSVGTPSHFLGFQLNERFGLDLVHVPAKGSGFQATDLMAGHVMFGFAQVQSTLPLIQEAKLNAIAITSGTRSRFLPNISTFADGKCLVRPHAPRRNPARRGDDPVERGQGCACGYRREGQTGSSWPRGLWRDRAGIRRRYQEPGRALGPPGQGRRLQGQWWMMAMRERRNGPDRVAEGFR
jgi:tripartite-type tricarboxylate transporter receptor subunit TctC